MDTEQEELQYLGFFGICRESIKIVSTWRKIFLKITLTLILPLSFIYLCNIGFSMLLAGKIIRNQDNLDETIQGTASYNKVSSALSSEWMEYILIKVVYLTFFLVFSLLSTSAVVYTVACVYSNREITYRRVMSVVPKVWKRLMVTFVCNFAIIVVYNICGFAILSTLILLFFWSGDNGVYTIVAIFFLFYFIGFVYITVIWQLASVVSVLEDSYGFQAMAKSKNLIKGKMIISIATFLIVNFFSVWIQSFFENNVVLEESIGIVGEVGIGLVSLVLLSIIFLFGLVVQTVIYFVCKSYHHENIDKSMLSDHLEVYLGDYVPLKAKDIQMEHI